MLRKRQEKIVFEALKLYMDKAYNRVSWNFLKIALTKMDFSNNMGGLCYGVAPLSLIGS